MLLRISRSIVQPLNELEKCARDAIYNSWHTGDIANVDAVARLAVSAISGRQRLLDQQRFGAMIKMLQWSLPYARKNINQIRAMGSFKALVTREVDMLNQANELLKSLGKEPV